MFTFVALHILFYVGRKLSAIADLLSLVERLEEIHTKVQGIISFPCLTTTLLYDVSQQWILHLNLCADASVLETL